MHKNKEINHEIKETSEFRKRMLSLFEIFLFFPLFSMLFRDYLTNEIFSALFIYIRNDDRLFKKAINASISRLHYNLALYLKCLSPIEIIEGTLNAQITKTIIIPASVAIKFIQIPCFISIPLPHKN